MNDYAISLLIIANIGLNIMIYFRLKYEHKRTRKESQEIKTRLHWVKNRQYLASRGESGETDRGEGKRG